MLSSRLVLPLTTSCPSQHLHRTARHIRGSFKLYNTLSRPPSSSSSSSFLKLKPRQTTTSSSFHCSASCPACKSQSQSHSQPRQPLIYSTSSRRPILPPTVKLDSQVRSHRDDSQKSPVASSHNHDHDHDHDHSHSHGLFSAHSHSHDNTYLTSKNKSDAGVRITRIGLYVNLGMAVSKGVGGWYFNSQALIADAVHALTDLVSDFMTLATVSWALKPPTDRFPNGFGKIESLGSLGVSSLLLFGGLAMGYSGCEHLYAQLFTDNAAAFLEHGSHGHSHSHSHTDLGPNINAAWLAGGSILVKEWLYRATMKIAKARQSSVLASNAVHHRIDSLTAMVALISISLSNVLHNAAWLDPVGGLLVSLMVIRAGWTNSRSALLELADTGLEESFKTKVIRSADDALTAQRLAGLEEKPTGKVKSVNGTKSGQNFLVDVVVAVRPTMTVAEMMELEGVVRTAVGSDVRGVKKVKVHCVPEGLDDVDEFIKVEGGDDLGSESEDEGAVEKKKEK